MTKAKPRPPAVKSEAISPALKEVKYLNAHTLEALKIDGEFRAVWSEVLKEIERFRLNEAILQYITTPKLRKGEADELGKQAAIDLWRQEGMLELWEILMYQMVPQLLDAAPAQAADVSEEDYSGDL